jgi:tetratricopeptide (TPR) repeat protein
VPASQPPPPAPARLRAERSGAAAVLLLLVALFHGPSLANGFAYDDAWTIVGNSFIRSPRNLLALPGPGPARAGVPDAGRPTLLATEMLDHFVSGSSPRGYHLQSLLWHAAVTLLLYAGLRRLCAGFLVPFAAAALFAVHPLNVEAVAAINYREDLLAAFFVLCSLHAMRAARHARVRLGALLRAVAVVALLVGLGAKENASVAPLLLAAIDVCADAGPLWSTLRGRLRDYLVLAAATLGAFAWRWWVMGAPAVVSRTAELADHGSRWTAIPAAAAAFVAGAGKLVLPVGFSPEYAPGGSTALGLAALLAIVGTFALAVRFRARAPSLCLGLMFAALAYLPNFGLVPLTNLRADRYFYLPALGLCLAAAALLVAGLERARRLRETTIMDLPAAWIAVAVLVLALGVRTVRQSRVWRDDLALWRHGTATAPTAPRAWLNLAAAQLHAAQTVEALQSVEHSLALDDDVHARELRALVLLQQGDLATARAELLRLVAIETLPDAYRAQLLNNLGFAELRARHPEAALVRLREAVRLAPRYELAAINEARALEELSQTAEAERVLRDLLGRVPESADGWTALGRLLESQDRRDEAAQASARARSL